MLVFTFCFFIQMVKSRFGDDHKISIHEFRFKQIDGKDPSIALFFETMVGEWHLTLDGNPTVRQLSMYSS